MYFSTFSWALLRSGVLGMSQWDEDRGETHNMLEALYLSGGLGTLWCPERRVKGCGQEERSLGISA